MSSVGSSVLAWRWLTTTESDQYIFAFFFVIRWFDRSGVQGIRMF